ncbi:MarR family transcriptional regulator [Vitreoscilla massiliensis]|uniref:MarR family transcriptional regulator n=1 Tax=Vitreoscilla massiliensis TaxID=1689272 RepID=A0ABY4E6P2_9NEIS|nr:MarR family transcriptional regulator [Vitreoscilla massiliensis]UOO91127.1 MarR family transcriptional regulator [Vitreoscilla massiliensis]
MTNKPNLKQHRDTVDVILNQWQQEHPHQDFSPMGPIGRIKRCAMYLEQQIEAGLSQYELSLWEFDMLATLRRSGSPYCMSPTELFSTLMVTSGTMTHRLKRLESRNLIERIKNEEDSRSSLVQLTNTGLELINQAVEKHLENEKAILARLPKEVIENLDEQLSLLLCTLETSHQQKAK